VKDYWIKSTQKLLKKNTQLLLSKILAFGSAKLFKITENKNEYKRLKRTLSKENKLAHLDENLVNDVLMGEALKKLSSTNEIYLIHDPSDIRKPHSKETEQLGKVLDLNHRVINGFSSYNVIAVTPFDKEVHLLSHKLYSNKSPSFLKAEYVRNLEENRDFSEKAAALDLYQSGKWFNKKTLAQSTLQKTSQAFKENNISSKITHILDREFDDEEYFGFIASLGDEFVIRVKKTRNALNNESENKKVKLISCAFENQHTIHIQKTKLNKQIYQDVTLLVEWKSYGVYTAVRITLKDRNQKNIFANPMLLITNKMIKTAEDANLVYQIYLKRSRIECVFKFLKEGMGWEEIQIQDFQSIQNLLSICFFLAAYLYEIKEQEVHDDFVILLAKIGGGKGVVSRHYIFQGIQQLVAKHRVDRILEEEKASQQTIEEMFTFGGICYDFSV